MEYVVLILLLLPMIDDINEVLVYFLLLLQCLFKTQAADTLSLISQNICELTYNFYHGLNKIELD